MISLFNQVENIVGKRGNAGYQHFLLFQKCFERFFPIKNRDCVVELILIFKCLKIKLFAWRGFAKNLYAKTDCTRKTYDHNNNDKIQ